MKELLRMLEELKPVIADRLDALTPDGTSLQDWLVKMEELIKKQK